MEVIGFTEFHIRYDLGHVDERNFSPKASSAVIQSWQEFQTRCACSLSRKTNKKIQNPQTFSFIPKLARISTLDAEMAGK